MAPRTPTAELLAGIWAELLHVERVGVHDNFFELGGHSLLAMRLVSRLRQVFDSDLPFGVLFEHPTLMALAAHIAAPHHAAATAPASRRRESPADPPASFAQQRLFFLQQFDARGWAYNIPVALRLRGTLLPRALAQALSRIVERHESLRTRFALRGEQPVQLIDPPRPLPLPVVDLQDAPELAEGIGTSESRRPFDLLRGPALRAVLLRLAPEDHHLLLTLHHVIGDAWSLEVLGRELAALYPACCSGRTARLPELPLQYADYAVWQRQWLQGETLQRQLEYWRAPLAGAAALELPTRGPRPAVQSYAGARHPLQVPAALTDALRQLSRRAGSTLFMTLLAAWNVLLQRYSGQSDIVVGTPISGRSRAELEGLIGFFLNTLALRTDLSDNPSYLDLLARVRETALAAYAHQDLPFEKLVEELQPQRDLSRSPLFQAALVVLPEAPLQQWKMAGLLLDTHSIESGGAKFDLTLSLTETTAGLQGLLNYRTDLFEAGFIARMAAHFERLLEQVSTHPERRIGDLRLLSEAERHTQLIDWNDTAVALPELCVHELFELQAARTPDAIALCDQQQQLSYRQLQLQSEELAGRLRALGAGPETRVGLCLERSVEMLVATLAVLKAGAAYVPLDPTYPPERLRLLIADAGLALVLTRQCWRGRLPSDGPLLWMLDGPQPPPVPHPAPPRRPSPDTLAYLMYTSGSSGTPKAVAIPHRGIVRLVYGLPQLQLGPQDVFLHLAPPSFDAATFEIWACLLHGARLVVAPTGLSLEDIAHRLQQQGVSILWLTAGLFPHMGGGRL